MYYGRVGFVVRGSLQFVAFALLTTSSVFADSVSDLNSLSPQTFVATGTATLKHVHQQTNQLLFSAQSSPNEKTSDFSTKRKDVSSGIGVTGYRVNDTPPPIANPEPATMILLGTGLTGVGWFIRRRRRLARKL